MMNDLLYDMLGALLSPQYHKGGNGGMQQCFKICLPQFSSGVRHKTTAIILYEMSKMAINRQTGFYIQANNQTTLFLFF